MQRWDLARRSMTLADVALWVVAISCSVAVLFLSLGPAPGLLDAFALSDKLFHAATYGVTTFLYLLAAVWRPGRSTGLIRRPLTIVLAAAVAGAALEIGQIFVAGRSPDPFDAVANTLGALAAWWVWSEIRKRSLQGAASPV